MSLLQQEAKAKTAQKGGPRLQKQACPHSEGCEGHHCWVSAVADRHCGDPPLK